VSGSNHNQIVASDFFCHWIHAGCDVLTHILYIRRKGEGKGGRREEERGGGKTKGEEKKGVGGRRRKRALFYIMNS
jgi:hypothetical protein